MELYVSRGKKGGKDTWSERGRQSLDNFLKLALAPFVVREIQRADGGNPHKHQDGGEQNDYNQGYLLVLSKEEQLDRQPLNAYLSIVCSPQVSR